MTEFVLPPGLIANQADWTLMDFTGIQQSPLSGAIRTISRGQRWQAHYLFHDIIGDDRAYLSALMAAIRGKSNRLWIADPAYAQRGSFPAPELLTNGSFAAGAAGWTADGAPAAVLSGFNRAMQVTPQNSTTPGAYQNVALASGIAYALRACIVDGPASAAGSLGLSLVDTSGTHHNLTGAARGLLTVAAIMPGNATQPQYIVTMTAGSYTPAQFVIVTYASLRRCAMTVNPGGLTYYTSLPCDALPASTGGLLRAGDRFEVNGELKTVTFDLNSDSTGAGQLMFEPALRKIVPDNTPIIIGEPMMRGIMSTDAVQPSRPGGFSDFDFTFVEA